MDSSVQLRGPDWANAAAVMGLALAPAFLATLRWGATPDDNGVAMFALFLWLVGLLLGLPFGWDALQARVTGSTLRVTGDEITGRTRGPVQRWRSVRVDQLAEVRYSRRWGGGGHDDHIVVRDQTGAQLMAVWPIRYLGSSRGYEVRPQHVTRERCCRILLRALDNSPSAQASDVTRARLASDLTWWSADGRGRSFLVFMLRIVILLSAFAAASALVLGSD